jgi:hypothetical protein
VTDGMMDKWVSEIIAKHATQHEEKVVSMVGLEFRQSINVRVRKPRWMPGWAYRRLMRTIVIEEGPITQARHTNHA